MYFLVVVIGKSNYILIILAAVITLPHLISLFLPSWLSAHSIIHSSTKAISWACVSRTGSGGRKFGGTLTVSLGNRPYSSQWCTAPEISWNGWLAVLVRLCAVELKGDACGVDGRHGSCSPSMMARRGYAMLKPP